MERLGLHVRLTRMRSALALPLLAPLALIATPYAASPADASCVALHAPGTQPIVVRVR